MSSLHRDYSSGHQHNCSKNQGNLFDLESQERQALAASIDDLDRSTFLSPCQQSAIETLRDLEDSKIMDLLSTIRLPSRVQHSCPAGLSNDHFEALLHLQSCSDSIIILSLRHSRVARDRSWNLDTSDLSTTQYNVPGDSGNISRRPLNASIRPSSSVPAHAIAYSDKTTRLMTSISGCRHRFQDDHTRQESVQEARPSTIVEKPSYGCVNIFCDRYTKRYVFEKCDGWKRHMREHVTAWRCMPNGPVEVTATGLICALCESEDPHETHISGHSIGVCGVTKFRSFSRRSDLEKHLSQSHAVPPSRTRGLAEKWRKPFPKYFACGFCICIFTTILEQLKHIDMEHFRKGQLITEWSATIVIQSLWSSPELAILLQKLLSWDAYTACLSPHWEGNMTGELQRRLHLAEDASRILSTEAYRMLPSSLSKQDSSRHHTSISLPSRQSKSATSPFPTSAERMEDFVHAVERGPEYPWFSVDYYAGFPFSGSTMPNEELPTGHSDTLEVTTSIEYQKSFHSASGKCPGVSAGGANSPQDYYCSTRLESRSGFTEPSSTSIIDRSSASSHWQAGQSITSNSSNSTGFADLPEEQGEIYNGSYQHLESLGTLNLDHGIPVETPSSGGVSFPLCVLDGGNTGQWHSQNQPKSHRDIDREPENARTRSQYDGHYPSEPLTCDPRDLIKR